MTESVAEGPYFDELEVGRRFRSAPGVTLTSGLASAHRAIVGGRMPLALDEALSREVADRAIAPPALVWDVAIGQSTVATHHVKANLFYRGLVLRRQPELGDTLRTSTEVVALRQNSPKPGRRPTGLAALRITTTDQEDRPVLDFWRCAMLPLRDEYAVTGHADDLDRVGVLPGPGTLTESVRGWRLDRIARRLDGPTFADIELGQRWQVGGGDVVSSGPELARLTLNIAKVHHDSVAAGGKRLVYGGHTIGLALAQVTRALPTIATVTGWRSCDHVGPVREGDTLRSTVEVEQTEPLAAGGGLVHLRSRVTADGDPGRAVLDWRFAVVVP
ncbi:MaoC family dehydratase [Amycolatopsis echigonensis]|uniref:Acyl dehydratase n=1 Tax=Amycolatopsis echigonensis TaxID=2576905 RepID=A0A8E1W9B7_9PSEU|nr:MaoC family dehydratase [Amycolatopsis echigonensis]MBB2505948.1 acyl dehydratase [Amycolatopsis echigonensis]